MKLLFALLFLSLSALAAYQTERINCTGLHGRFIKVDLSATWTYGEYLKDVQLHIDGATYNVNTIFKVPYNNKPILPGFSGMDMFRGIGPSNFEFTLLLPSKEPINHQTFTAYYIDKDGMNWTTVKLSCQEIKNIRYN